MSNLPKTEHEIKPNWHLHRLKRIASNRNLMKRPAFRNFSSPDPQTVTQCSSGFVPFLQTPLGFGQAQEQISPQSSIINTVMTEECS